MRRVVVMGTAGSGKTTVAAALARRLGVPHVELDELAWGPDWESTPPAVLRERVEAAVGAEAWVVDGNYTAVRDLVWPKADAAVWLDPPRRVVMWRVITRTVRRILTREVLWSGNREKVRTAFSRDSIVLWAWTTYDRRHRDYPDQLAAYPNLAVHRLQSARDVDRFLAGVSSPEAAPTAPRTPAGPGDTPAGAGTTRSGPTPR